MNKIILLEPIFLQKIWGSNYLKNKKRTSLNSVGEMWSLSCLENNETKCINDIYKDKTINDLYKDTKLFGETKYDKFPILVKLLTTSQDLSIQVHPNDEYALKNENSLGKEEGWLILKKSINSKILLSHKLNSKEEIKDMIINKNYKNKLNYINPKVGNFYPIPAQTLHALGKDIVLLEIQQSSDVTYRVYDYDRPDKNGKLRELHISKALDCISTNKYNEKVTNINSFDNGELWENNHFKVSYNKINGLFKFDTKDKYLIGTIAKGKFKYDGFDLIEGDSFIVPIDCNETLFGKGIILFTEEV